MLTNPLLLFCDEPTTGLDSSSSAVVIKLLKKFSSEGRIVISSIHQPTASTFELFDFVLLLATGGQMAYFGPISHAIAHFQKFDTEFSIIIFSKLLKFFEVTLLSG